MGDLLLEAPVTDENEAPAPPTLSSDVLPEDAEAGFVIGVLSVEDPDGNQVSFILLDDADGRVAVTAAGQPIVRPALRSTSKPKNGCP